MVWKREKTNAWNCTYVCLRDIWPLTSPCSGDLFIFCWISHRAADDQDFLPTALKPQSRADVNMQSPGPATFLTRVLFPGEMVIYSILRSFFFAEQQVICPAATAHSEVGVKTDGGARRRGKTDERERRVLMRMSDTGKQFEMLAPLAAITSHD